MREQYFLIRSVPTAAVPYQYPISYTAGRFVGSPRLKGLKLPDEIGSLFRLRWIRLEKVIQKTPLLSAQEPTDTSKQPIRVQYFLIRSVPVIILQQYPASTHEVILLVVLGLKPKLPDKIGSLFRLRWIRLEKVIWKTPLLTVSASTPSSELKLICLK
eukprot:sb/3473003/